MLLFSVITCGKHHTVPHFVYMSQNIRKIFSCQILILVQSLTTGMSNNNSDATTTKKFTFDYFTIF